MRTCVGCRRRTAKAELLRDVFARPTLWASDAGLAQLIERVRREKPTIRQLYLRAGITGSARIGTPSDIADIMQEWFEASACDGFNVTPATLPGGGEDFVALVVPELQRRGLFRTEYSGKTLRENLGLRPVVNRYSRDRQAAE